MTKRKTIKSMTVSEISTVDRPAQKGATVSIMKRDGGGEVIEKRKSMTTVVNGHQHILSDDYGNGEMNSGSTDYQDGHQHPWIRDAAGNITIGIARGHTHELGIIGKKEDNMTAITNTAELDTAIAKFEKDGGTNADIAAIQKAATDLGAEDKLPAQGALAKADDSRTTALEAEIAKMKEEKKLTPAEKAIYDKMTDEDKKKFLSKSEADRQSEINKAAGDDPVIYTTLDGTELRKSADPALVAMAKRADAQSKDLALEKAAREDMTLEKRAADELSNIGGETIGKKALLKAVDGIEDEQTKTAALAVLKAADAAAKVGTTTSLGSNGNSSDGSGFIAKSEGQVSAEDELEKMAKAHAKENNVSFEKAYSAVAQTVDGQKLYKASLQKS